MNFLHSLCIMWFSSVGSFMADSQIISARVGSTTVLPCRWRTVSFQTPHVQWSTVSETVLERKGVELYEGEGYKNRVDVPEDELLKGNCSLVLKNVRLADAGVYESYLSVMRMKRASSTKWILVQSVELSVDETPGENFYNKLTTTDDAGGSGAPPQTIHVSLLSCLLFLGFY